MRTCLAVYISDIQIYIGTTSAISATTNSNHDRRGNKKKHRSRDEAAAASVPDT